MCNTFPAWSEPRAAVRDCAGKDDPDLVKGKRVLVVEDGPTLTHGEMPYGAGVVAANRFGASKLVDPRPFAVGSIQKTFEKFQHLGKVLPAMGYSDGQLAEMEKIIDAAEADLVVIGTPIDLRRIIDIRKPAVRVRYDLLLSRSEVWNWRGCVLREPGRRLQQLRRLRHGLPSGHRL